jgi:mono/diheme cytochrome c family protein
LVIGAAVGGQQIKKVPIHSTSAASGRETFAAYCAVCHGTAGRGDGPIASALKKRPVDLTQLSRNNGGTFPEGRVMGYITGEETVAADGNRDMPIWGELFRSLDPNSRELSDLRVHNLAEYVKALQAKWIASRTRGRATAGHSRRLALGWPRMNRMRMWPR